MKSDENAILQEVAAAHLAEWRAGLKHDSAMDDNAKQIEDLKKAVWYINKKIEMLEKGEPK